MERTFFKLAIMNAIEGRKKKTSTYSSRFFMAILFAKYLKNQDDFVLSSSYYSLSYHLLLYWIVHYIFDRFEFPVHVRPFHSLYMYTLQNIYSYICIHCVRSRSNINHYRFFYVWWYLILVKGKPNHLYITKYSG